MMKPLLLTLVSSLSLAALPDSLTLEEALELSHQHQPTLRQAQAQVDAAQARARETLAPLLPTVSMSVGYSRSTANFVARPGAVPSSVDTASTLSLNSFDYWNANLTASATLWDFGQKWNRYQASLSSADAQAATQKSMRRTSDYSVRTLFFAAASQKDLVEVDQKALDNTKEHFAQIEGMVKVGTRPEIDLAQARADVANARFALLNAKNAYAIARAKLSQAMGLSIAPTYEIDGTGAVEVDGEAREATALLDEALSARPEAAALAAQVKSQELTIKSTRGAYLPSLGVQLGGTLASRQLPTIVPNLNAQLTLNWALYEGGVTSATEREGEANLRALEAERDGFKLQVQLDLQQALLDVSAAKEGVDVSGEATAAAQEKLRLAEGRYRAGAGNALELSDAQVAASQAAAQAVQAKFTLSAARAALIAALGRT